jgi:chromosome segregation ATPase
MCATWYVLAKKDKRYRYDFHPVLGRSHVFKSLKKAETMKKKKEKELNITLDILKRTCKPL